MHLAASGSIMCRISRKKNLLENLHICCGLKPSFLCKSGKQCTMTSAFLFLSELPQEFLSLVDYNPKSGWQRFFHPLECRKEHREGKIILSGWWVIWCNVHGYFYSGVSPFVLLVCKYALHIMAAMKMCYQDLLMHNWLTVPHFVLLDPSLCSCYTSYRLLPANG